MSVKNKALEVRSISKRFGGVIALDNVSLSVREGEVLCLLGENGAGKSTLINIISGVYQPDAGEIHLDGEAIIMKNPHYAHQKGISTVYQELVQYPDMNIMENIFSGRYEKRWGLIRKQEMYKKTLGLMDRVGISFDPTLFIRDLSVAQRQLVEILKAVSYDSRIIVFDEPTASLTEEETRTLFKIIERLKASGSAIIYISHRLEEVFRIGDRVVVLKDGKNSGEGLVKDLDHDRIISMMVGREIEARYPKREKRELGVELLRVTDLNSRYVHDISFDLREGEILGIGGLVGAGRTEMVRALTGLDSATGEFLFRGKKILNKSPEASLRNRIATVPEDRKGQGLITILTVKHNIGLSSLRALSKLGFMNRKKELNCTVRYIDRLRIKTTGPQQPVEDLSGGNQQKIVMAKCLATEPEILILDEPTRGIDVGTKVEIYQLMKDYVKTGKAIIMVSSELPELLGISDRILVMRGGRITQEIVDVEQATEESVMRYAIARGQS